MSKFPKNATFLNKKNAQYWAKRSNHNYRIRKVKGGYKVKYVK